MRVLSFALNNVDFGIPVETVESIETRSNVLHIPGAPPNIKGIMRLHGSIIPVYSLASRFSYHDEAVENIIVATVSDMKIGLEVNKVKEIIEVEVNEVVPMPQIMNATQHCFSTVACYHGGLIALLNVDKLLTAQELQGMRQLIDDHKES